MRQRTIHLAIRVLILGIAMLISVSVIFAATFVNNTTSGGPSPDAPVWLAPGWEFTAQSDTVSGESVCIEVHPQGGTNYTRQECVFAGGSGPFDWTCSVFESGVPAAFQTQVIEYQFFISDSGSSCTTNTYAFTGFNWTFGTGPTAVSLQSITATTPPTRLIISVIALITLTIGGLWFYKKRGNSYSFMP